VAAPTSKKTTVKVLCRECRRVTNHKILCSDLQSGDDEETGFWWREENSLIRCAGCDNVALLKSGINSESIPDDDVRIYPDPEHGREPLDDYWSLPTQPRKIYIETLKALDNKQPILAGIGIRAIVETVCKERKAKVGNLEKKIDDLKAQGVLTGAGADLLHKLRIIGNKAAHEVKPHTSRELSLAIDVINHLLLGVYILPKNAQETFEK
jgi:hypothetical protein